MKGNLAVPKVKGLTRTDIGLMRIIRWMMATHARIRQEDITHLYVVTVRVIPSGADRVMVSGVVCGHTAGILRRGADSIERSLAKPGQ